MQNKGITLRPSLSLSSLSHQDLLSFFSSYKSTKNVMGRRLSIFTDFSYGSDQYIHVCYFFFA